MKGQGVLNWNSDMEVLPVLKIYIIRIYTYNIYVSTVIYIIIFIYIYVVGCLPIYTHLFLKTQKAKKSTYFLLSIFSLNTFC